MPKFRGKVVTTIVGYITVEAEDMYQADAIGQDLSSEEINAMQQISYDEIEVFPDELPEEVK